MAVATPPDAPARLHNEDPAARPDQQDVQASGFLKGFAGLACAIGALVSLVWLVESGAAIRTAEQALEQRLGSEASASAKALGLVIRKVQAEAGPLIGSDLVRVVAAHLAAENGNAAREPASWLRTQVPFVHANLANLLRGHGLDGAALLSVHGRTLLSSGQAPPPPPSDAWRRGPALGAVRLPTTAGESAATGPQIDVYFAVPATHRAAGEGSSEPVAILALTLPAVDLLRDVLTAEAASDPRSWLAQSGSEGEERLVFEPEPALVPAPRAASRDPLWPLVGEGPTSITATAPVERAPFRIVRAARADVLLDQAADRARITLPVALTLVLALALLMAFWRHRRAPSPSDRVQTRQPMKTQASSYASESLDDLSTPLRVEDLVTAIPLPAALIDDQGRITAANPAFILETARPEVIGLHLAVAFGEPGRAAWQEVLTSTRTEGVVTTIGKGRDHRPVLFVARRIQAQAGSTLLMLRDAPEAASEERQLQAQNDAMVATLVRAVELRDPFMLGHTERLRRLGGDVARHLGLTGPDCATLDLAAALSQIGKIFVPDAVLTKPGRHDAAEARLMRAHIEHAARVLEPLDFGLPVTEVLMQMHERLDGSGYPHGLKGDAIGLPARILGVVDVFCARTSARTYRDRVLPGQALYHLARHPDRYDAEVVAALAALVATAERSPTGTDLLATDPQTEGTAAA